MIEYHLNGHIYFIYLVNYDSLLEIILKKSRTIDFSWLMRYSENVFKVSDSQHILHYKCLKSRNGEETTIEQVRSSFDSKPRVFHRLVLYKPLREIIIGNNHYFLREQEIIKSQDVFFDCLDNQTYRRALLNYSHFAFENQHFGNYKCLASISPYYSYQDVVEKFCLQIEQTEL
jgi:hypothetical protein